MLVGTTKKRCNKCKRVRSLTNFYRSRSGRRAGHPVGPCKECAIKHSRDWYRANPVLVTYMNIRKNHGLSKDEYDAMVAKSGGKCAICGRKRKRLHIDHCHRTGKIRGMLCQNCNIGLGQFMDSTVLLHEAGKYLRRNA